MNLVSIIIPAYNYGRYLTDAIQAIQSQTYANWECLVIDDGSTDDTATIVARLENADRRVRYIFQDNSGQAAARNLGLKHANGTFIQFLDADDLLEPHKLETQVRLFIDNPQLDIVYGSVRYFTNESPHINFYNRWDKASMEWMPMLSGEGSEIVEAFARYNILELGSALFRKQALPAQFSFDSLLVGVEDYDFCFRLAIAGCHFYYHDAPGTKCLMRHHSESYSKSRLIMYRKELLLRRKISTILSESPYKDLNLVNLHAYNERLKKLQDLSIDMLRKGDKMQLDPATLKWHFSVADWGQRCYYFPRIIKAAIYNMRNKRH